MDTARAEELRCRLALLRAPGLGGAAQRALLQRFGGGRALFDASRAELAAAGVDKAAIGFLRDPDWRGPDQDLRWAGQPGNQLLIEEDAAYPALLRETPDPPPLLFVSGDTALLASPQLAVVGSRNPTPSGRETALALARRLAEAGLTITSGLAMGIDAAAHEGALAASAPTIAVAGTGLDRVYPARHLALARRIAETGALVSEFPTGTPPQRGNFPRRNRIISGLSLGTLVVEATLQSGSLITARLALEQGREVFAVPGSIHSPLSRGCNALIRDGAKLVETETDVLEELGPLAGFACSAERQAPRAAAFELDAEHRRVLDALGYEPTSVDTVVQRSGLTAEAVCSMLLVLELHGYAASTPGGRYCRAVKRS